MVGFKEWCRKENIKIPLSEKMLDYYLNLGYTCQVLGFGYRMDGSIWIGPAYISPERIMSSPYCLVCTISDIKDMINNDSSKFLKRHEQRCKEILAWEQDTYSAIFRDG